MGLQWIDATDSISEAKQDFRKYCIDSSFLGREVHCPRCSNERNKIVKNYDIVGVIHEPMSHQNGSCFVFLLHCCSCGNTYMITVQEPEVMQLLHMYQIELDDLLDWKDAHKLLEYEDFFKRVS